MLNRNSNCGKQVSPLRGRDFRTWNFGENVPLWSPDPAFCGRSSCPAIAGSEGPALGSWGAGIQTLRCTYRWVWMGAMKLVLGVGKEAGNWSFSSSFKLPAIRIQQATLAPWTCLFSVEVGIILLTVRVIYIWCHACKTNLQITKMVM